MPKASVKEDDTPLLEWIFGAIGTDENGLNAATTRQRQQVEGFLAWDGGIQSSLAFDHPYRCVRP